MPISATSAAQIATCLPAHSPRHRFTIRSEGGFLAACVGIGGPPVAVVPDHRNAVQFVDLHTAFVRARLMTELGWSNLRVVEILLD